MNENESAKAEVKFGQDNITIIFPKEIAKYLNIGPRAKNKDVYFTLTNKVVQLSAGQPMSEIPILTEQNCHFQLQSE